MVGDAGLTRQMPPHRNDCEQRDSMHDEHRTAARTAGEATNISGASDSESRFSWPSLSAIRAEWLVLCSVVLASTGQLMIKLGLNHHASIAGGSLPLHGMVPTVCGLLVYALGTLLWIEAVRKRDISYLYPLSAINYTLVALGGMFFLGEVVSSARWAGIVVITLGVGLMMSSRDGASESDREKAAWDTLQQNVEQKVTQ